MRLSFIIPAYNEERYIGKCLASILGELRRGGSRDVEIIVVDNAATDRTAEIAKTYPGVRVVSEPQKGLTYARQRGLLEARGVLLAYLDADTHLPPHWLSFIEPTFRDPNIVCLSGPYRYYDLTGWRKSFAEATWWLVAPLTYRLVGYMVLGGNFVARRDALSAMGGFDTSIRFYGEDTNIAWRLAKMGRVVFRMDFFALTSGRRLLREWIFTLWWIYGINYLWGALFHRPFTHDYRDIR